MTTKRKPTTILGWLKTLPEPERSRAIANYKKHYKNDWNKQRKSPTMQDSIYGAFIWIDSPEGEKYWVAVHDGNRGELPKPRTISIPIPAGAKNVRIVYEVAE